MSGDEIIARIMFDVEALADKMGFDRDKLIEFISHVANIAEGISKGYIRYDDLHRVLVEEQGLEW